MITLHCTQNLFKLLQVEPEEQEVPATGALGDWYANLVSTAAGDLVLLVNERTLLSVAVPVQNIKSLIPMFRIRVMNLLAMIHIPLGIIEREVMNLNEIRFGKATNHAVIGLMNTLAWAYQEKAKGVKAGEGISLSDVELDMSAMVSSQLENQNPADLAKSLLLSHYI